jgi:hypothetical protein
MDNFDLRKYLVENKVTINSRMLREQNESWVLMIGHPEYWKDFTVEDPYTGPTSVKGMEKYVNSLGLTDLANEPDNTLNLGAKHPDFAVFEPYEGNYAIFAKKSFIENSESYQGKMDGEFMADLHYELMNNYNDYFLENKITRNSKLINEETPGKPAEVEVATFSNGQTFEKEGEDMEGGIVTRILKYPKGYAIFGQEYDWNNGEYEEEAYVYYYDMQGNEVEENEIM